MTSTGIFATKEEIKEVQRLAERASRTPCILIVSGTNRHDVAADAWQECSKKCHELALKHGLPETKGFYGMTEEGEFVTEETESREGRNSL